MNFSRRDFLKTTGVAAAGLAATQWSIDAAAHQPWLDSATKNGLADIAIPLASGDEGGLVNEAAEMASSPGELVEPGRALALADFAPPSVGAGERLIRLAYRFGISGSALSAHRG